MELKQKLKYLRKQKKLSQMELSEKLMVSRQAVSSWEAGTSRPSTENLRGLSQLYDVQIEYLLNEDETVPPLVVLKKTAEDDKSKKDSDIRRSWGKMLLLVILVLILVACSTLFLIRAKEQRNDDLELHEIQGEAGDSHKSPEFNLIWE